MSETIDRLNAALEGRYSIERELGAGGMATVYLAEDSRHHRKVAVKVLRPDLAASLGSERFLREIEIAARLTHPHILPLHDSGEADGFLFYVLPYIEGESLRDRIVREGELPVAEAVRIIRDVVDALSHAHDQGVVHRDIKPDNVMLSGRHAMVMDFGVAKAVSEATGRQQVTTVGVALGTPAYMAPEQAEASEQIDHRADIYAVGTLAYELLTGRPPFSDKTPQMLLVAHVTETPEPVTTRRETTPAALAHLVMRCLEKKPADRWQSAEEMLRHLDALATPSGGLTPTDTLPVSVSAPGGSRRIFTQARVGVAAAVVLAAAFGVSQMRSGGGPGATADGDALDPDVVAIMPFRFSGPDDLAYLGDGIVDLLAARLTGDVGPRAADPAATNAIWQDRSEADPSGAAESTARALGAGLMLTGSIVTDPSGLNVNATLRSVVDASEVASASASGPADSLTVTVDRVAASLLSLSAGEYPESLDQLTSTSPEALRAYLLGRQQFKGARFLDSGEHFRRAIEIDSTFALAAIGWADAAANGLATAPGALGLAWRHRDRLSERDRAYLQARLGPNYPERSSTADQIRSWESAAGLSPDRAQIWYQLGDLYLHGVDQRTAQWAQRTRSYFQRAVELDPRHVASIMHLAFVDAVVGDLTAARADWLSIAELAASAEESIIPNLMVAALSPDLSGFPEALAATLASPSMNDLVTPAWQIEFAAVDTVVVGAVRELMEEAMRRPMTAAESFQAHYSAFLLFQDLGRPAQAMEAAGPWEAASPISSPRTILLNATYGSLPQESGAAQVAKLEAQLAGEADYTATQLQHFMAIEMWRLAQGDSGGTEATIRILEDGATRQSELNARAVRAAALVFEARLAVERDDPQGAESPLAQAEDLLAQGLRYNVHVEAGLLFMVADLYGRLDDPESALATLDRGPRFQEGALFVTPALRERGRLAALTGDVERAIREYERYLSIRYDPEPSLVDEVEEVRQALADLRSR